MTEKEYRKLSSISYSNLKNLDKDGPSSIKDHEEVDLEAFALGKYVEEVVEELITGDTTLIQSKFIVTDTGKPTAMLGTLADAMIANSAELTVTNAFLLAKGLGLWSSIVNETTYRNKFDKPEFWDYLHLKKEASRIIISRDLAKLGDLMGKSVHRGQFTRDIFKKRKNVDFISQMIIEWGNKQFRSMLDYVEIDHNKHTITPYDLKTSGFPIEDFVSNGFYKQRYYIQSSMYTDALEEWKFDNYPDYTLKPFQFIVVSRLQPTKPLRYTISDSVLEAGREGFYRDDRLVRKGYIQLAKEYKWYVDNDKFDFSMSTYENNGNILIE